MFDYKHFAIGNNINKLVFFLHGYNGNIQDHMYAVDWLCRYLHNCHIIIPDAPEICDKNPQKKQWFGMIKYDAENKRRSVETSADEIFSIYEKAHNDIFEKSQQINEFISIMQKKLSISEENTFVIGFSQGAMLAASSSLMRAEKIGGTFMLSGLIASKNFLSKNIKSRPDFYVFHGEKDSKIQYKTLEQSVNWLKNNQITAKVYTYQNLKHFITEDEIIKISAIINKD